MNKVGREYYADQFAELTKNKGHEIVDGIYVNNKSILKIRCSKHRKPLTWLLKIIKNRFMASHVVCNFMNMVVLIQAKNVEKASKYLMKLEPN